MATDFKFPDVGEGITEGEIVKWHVSVGDVVKEHDVLAEVETDKAIVQIPSPVSGTILRLDHKEGDTIQVGETLAVIGEKGEAAGKKEIPEEKKTPGDKKKDFGAVVGELPEADDEAHEPIKKQPAQSDRKEILASPATRNLAKDLGIDLSSLQGSGAEGRVTEDDVRNASAKEKEHSDQPMVVRKYDMFGYVEHVPLKGVRKATARHMVESLYTATHVAHMDEADVTDLYFIREKEKVELRKKGVHLTFLPFIIKAVILALKEHPYLNSTLDSNAGEIILRKYYNIGVAVDIEGGLIVPVVKQADKKTISEIAKEIQELAEKTKDRTLDIMDMKGGTFTITNIGSIGGIFATPIINYPEVAILATGKIMDKPVVQDGRITSRKIMPFSLSFDHRVIDGAEAARFATRLIELLQDPDGLMIE